MFFQLLLASALAFPLLETDTIIVGEGTKALTCDKSVVQTIRFLNLYKSYTPQVIVSLHNYTNVVQFSDYAVDLYLTDFTIELVCSKSTVKQAVFQWYAFGGDTYDSGCVPLEKHATASLDQTYMQPMQHAAFIAGFAGVFKYGGVKPQVALNTHFDQQQISINVESTFSFVYVCYILAQDLSSAVLNETEVQQLILKKSDVFDTVMLGLQQFTLVGNNLQFQLLNDKNFFPQQYEMHIKAVKLIEPTYRNCPKVYPQCMFQGDPIYVCQETVTLTKVWKEFRSLQVFDQKVKFKMNIAQEDNILWLSEDIDCSYDIYDQLMEMKIRNQPSQREMLKKRKILGMLYDDSEDNVLTGQDN